MRAAMALVGLALVVAACGGGESGLQSVRDPDRQLYFELPSDWSVLQSGDLEGVTTTPFVAQDASVTLPVVSRVVFEGAERDLVDPAAEVSTSTHPIGSAVVRTIPQASRDLISRYVLAEAVVPYHSQPAAQEALKEDISIAPDYDGVQLIVVYSDAVTGSDTAVAFISVTDPDVQRLYSIAVGCSTDCFVANQDAILNIIDSWVVNTR